MSEDFIQCDLCPKAAIFVFTELHEDGAVEYHYRCYDCGDVGIKDIINHQVIS